VKIKNPLKKIFRGFFIKKKEIYLFFLATFLVAFLATFLVAFFTAFFTAFFFTGI
jgi:hypothetical protein